MTEPRYIDPNSGAAPQPGGAVVGGAESLRGEQLEEFLQNVEPQSDQEAEVVRQVEVGKNQEDAKQGEEGASEPKAAETPTLPEPTAVAPKPAQGTQPAAEGVQGTADSPAAGKK